MSPSALAPAEARVLSSTALTRVFTHVYLRDPNVDLDSLLEPASGELAAAAAEAGKGRAEALLVKFCAFSTKPRRGAADPEAPRGETASAAPPPAMAQPESDPFAAPVLVFSSCNMHHDSWRRFHLCLAL